MRELEQNCLTKWNIPCEIKATVYTRSEENRAKKRVGETQNSWWAVGRTSISAGRKNVCAERLGKTLWLSARGCIFAAGGCKIPGVRQLAGINNVTSGAQEIRRAALIRVTSNALLQPTTWYLVCQQRASNYLDSLSWLSLGGGGHHHKQRAEGDRPLLAISSRANFQTRRKLTTCFPAGKRRTCHRTPRECHGKRFCSFVCDRSLTSQQLL